MVARDAPIGFTVDRLLSPRSLTTRTIAIESGTSVRLAGRVAYDPARRRVAFAPDPGQTLPGIEYVLVVTTGVLAWDGSALDAQIARAFVAGADVWTAPPSPTRPSLRADVAPLLAHRCAFAGCHAGGADSVMGLDLSSPEAILATAVRVASRESGPDDSSTGSATDPRWSALLRVDPGDGAAPGAPAYSYLFYKLVGDGPMLGERMPPSSAGPPLDDDEIARVSDWIARGAPDD